MAYSITRAGEVAQNALLYIAGDTELIQAFMAETGILPQDLRKSIAGPAFAISVLDFLLQDDQRVIGFASTLGSDPAEIMTARTALAGPGSFGWEAC